MAAAAKDPSLVKNVLDAGINLLNNKINNSTNREEREILRKQLPWARVTSNLFGKLAEYPSSQYDDLMFEIKWRGMPR